MDRFDNPLDIRRRWAEMFCTNPLIWQKLADDYRKAGRLSMAAYCERDATHYTGVGQWRQTEPFSDTRR